jgi:hypothetical protein
VDQGVLDRLDKVIVLLNLASRQQIEAARREVLADPISAALIDVMNDEWVGAADLRRRVAASTGQSQGPVSRRLSQLVSQGWVASSGSGGNIRYRATGA